MRNQTSDKVICHCHPVKSEKSSSPPAKQSSSPYKQNVSSKAPENSGLSTGEKVVIGLVAAAVGIPWLG